MLRRCNSHRPDIDITIPVCVINLDPSQIVSLLMRLTNSKVKPSGAAAVSLDSIVLKKVAVH